MKTTTLKTLFGSFLVAGTLVFLPTTTFATDASTTATVRIGADGITHIVNAEVTSVSGNLINAVTNFKNNVMNWTFTTNASTTIAANNTGAATLADVHVGDKLSVTGILSAINSTFNVTASKIHDTTSTSTVRVKTGTVQSINTASSTFVLRSDDKLVTVFTNASTTFSLGSGMTIAATTLANLPLNAKVAVSGILSADKTSIQASKVLVFLGDIKKEKEDHENNKDHKKNTSQGLFHGLKVGWFLNGHLDR